MNEPVLVIPEVLALLGDNPMQSEFACHIGLRGKLFCRACWVKGTDAMDGDDQDVPPTTTDAAHSDSGSVADSHGGSDGGSVVGSEARSIAGSEGSTASQAAAPKRKANKKMRETMAQMVTRVKAFMKVILCAQSTSLGR